MSKPAIDTITLGMLNPVPAKKFLVTPLITLRAPACQRTPQRPARSHSGSEPGLLHDLPEFHIVDHFHRQSPVRAAAWYTDRSTI